MVEIRVLTRAYAIYISPLFDLEDLTAFANDNFTIKIHTDIQLLKFSLENSISNISNWMKVSGLKI